MPARKRLSGTCRPSFLAIETRHWRRLRRCVQNRLVVSDGLRSCMHGELLYVEVCGGGCVYLDVCVCVFEFIANA
eukprot:6177952-Pleurochrysis_carterae.AAC.2